MQQTVRPSASLQNAAAYRRKVLIHALAYVFLGFVLLTVILPFAWVFSNAFRANDEIGKFTDFSLYTFLPKDFTMNNFVRMFQQLNMVQILLNTLLVALAVMFGSLFINALTAYAFARIRFVGKNALFLLLISMLVLPIEILIIPLYLTVAKMNLSDTYWALIVPFLAAPFGIFFMRQFFSSIPRALDEAAILDGCGHFQIFSRIFIPLSKTPLFTLGLLVFMQQWDSFIVPVTLINDESKMVLQVALTRLSMGLYMTDYGVLYAGVALSIVPMLIVYLLFQKNIVENIAAVGIK
ncbi:MAG: carbohydrate ABC transporter permease [Candidatus Limiplasma sp.]|nr:carbohydrate ABC transporter permease [Candidatus Limiplasma sp.]